MIQVMLPTMGVHMPSDIQHSAIPLIKDGRSIALQSYTGSGKVRTPSCEMVFM
jgi:superfamily II DNA/RNA helicase